MSKLPTTTDDELFGDSPLRPTPKRPATAAAKPSAAAAQPPTSAPAPAARTTTEANAAVPPSSPSTATAAVGAQKQEKLTIYISADQLDDIEDEVHRRRRAGVRGFGRTDLMREILDEWRKRLPRKTP